MRGLTLVAMLAVAGGCSRTAGSPEREPASPGLSTPAPAADAGAEILSGWKRAIEAEANEWLQAKGVQGTTTGRSDYIFPRHETSGAGSMVIFASPKARSVLGVAHLTKEGAAEWKVSAWIMGVVGADGRLKTLTLKGTMGGPDPRVLLDAYLKSKQMERMKYEGEDAAFNAFGF